MFDAILKSRFYSRCKTEIKLTMKRIEIVRRKRSAMQKFLRNDVADLLKTGLDSNAYDRVGQLYADQRLSWCYEFLEQSCLLILSLLSSMNKQRECPEECKQAVSTLMFAAARFADLPELRELRNLFSERYGNYLEHYVNQEFVMNLKADSPTNQIKLQMIKEIALEYGINLDLKTLDQKLYKSPPFVQDLSQHTNGKNHEFHRQNDQETNMKKETEKEEKNKNHSTVGNRMPYKSRDEIETKKEEKHDHGRLSPYWSSNTSSSSDGATSADDSASEDIIFLVKTESTKKSTVSDNLQSGRVQGRKGNGLRSMGPPYIKPDLSKKTAGLNVDNLKSEEETEDIINKPASKSVRNQRPLKQAAAGFSNDYDVMKTNTKLFDGEIISFHDYDVRDDEEKVDKLLLHYSKKPSHLPAPKRTGSLPTEPVAAGVGVGEIKGLSRANTYQPDAGLGHVHPKLPDYDDFVARLAAFRASS